MNDRRKACTSKPHLSLNSNASCGSSLDPDSASSANAQTPGPELGSPDLEGAVNKAVSRIAKPSYQAFTSYCAGHTCVC